MQSETNEERSREQTWTLLRGNGKSEGLYIRSQSKARAQLRLKGVDRTERLVEWLLHTGSEDPSSRTLKIQSLRCKSRCCGYLGGCCPRR